MTDTFHPVSTLNGHDLSAVPLTNHHDALHIQQFGVAPMIDEVQDDDGQISCICGFSDDDGNTVACDSCNRWQHTICYYPQYEGRDLPEELQHFCFECRPQPYDAQPAILRQRQRREQQDSLVNGNRRPVSKSHKKKTRDAQMAPGWPSDKTRHDRNSASPRDHAPPAKRPKTSHRTSESNSNAQVKGHSRKRTASNINHGRNHSDSPERLELYSPEFLRCYQQDDWAITQANLHNDISITNALTEWLRAHDDEFRVMHGHDKRDILMRWDGQLEDIPGKAQIDIQEVSDDRVGPNDVSWKIVTVKEPVAQGAYIGELKGHVGFIRDYKMDPANRWSQLRHPEPFVFFHPSLQLYIDARQEGTELRYVRRSCRPNAKLQILVTDQTDYRFCFMAQEQINPGMEVAVAWDTAESVPNASNGLSTKDMDMLSVWVSNVLANCGPCACNTADCAMSRFDRRREYKRESEDGLPSYRSTKNKKRKPAVGRHVSPLTPQILNSRSGSEIRKGEIDDEHADTRSTSGSGGGSLSRDITPSTHYMTTGGTELSERERKKLAKEEEMFRRQAEEQISRQGKKKRNSAGSNLSTAQAHSAKQTIASATRYIDAGVGRGPPSNAMTRVHKKNRTLSSVKPSSRAIPHPSRSVMANYTSNGTQVDMDEVEVREQVCRPLPRQRFVSRQQYLLRYLVEKDMKIKVHQASNTSAEALLVKELSPVVEATALDVTSSDVVMNDSSNDTAMIDAPEIVASPTSENDPLTHISHNPHQAASDDAELTNPSANQDAVFDTARGLPELHLTMQPPILIPSAVSTESSQSLTASNTPHTVTSPSSLMGLAGPVFSPAVTASITPSPARKKLSLSDYTRRSKAKDKDADPKLERDSSPASTASGPIGLSTIDPKSSDAVSVAAEDIRMDDVISNELVDSKT